MGGEIKQQELKLRQLAKPLAEARKDPQLNKAVLFVEELFGRELKTKRDVLLITGDNKNEYWRALKEDSEKLERIYSPVTNSVSLFSPILSLFYSKEKIEELYRGINPNRDWHIITVKDLLRPIKFVKENVHVWVPVSRSLNQIGSKEEPKGLERLLSNKTAGMHLGHENLIILEEKMIPQGGWVHELIHAEDQECLDAANPFYRILTEGRATFGQWLFNLRDERFILQDAGVELSAADTLQVLVAAKRQSMFGNGGIIQRNFSSMRESLKCAGKKPGMLATFDAALHNFLKEIKSTSIEDQRLYIPFRIALAELAHALKDPYAAFRITTEKQPRTIEDIKNVKEFYKKEIEGHRKTN